MEQAVEKAVLTAVEAQLARTASCTPQGASPRYAGSICQSNIEGLQQVQHNGGGSSRQKFEPGFIPSLSRRLVLVRQVSGPNSLLENEDFQVFSSDITPLGASPDMMEQDPFAFGTSPGTAGGMPRRVRITVHFVSLCDVICHAMLGLD